MHPELPSRVFDDWWHHEGRWVPSLPDEDAGAHAKRICRLAWLEAVSWAYGKARADSLDHLSTMPDPFRKTPSDTDPNAPF